MRDLLVSLFVSSSLIGVAACGDGDGGVYSPSNPADFDRRMVNQDAIERLSFADGAYVTGHAIGVYLLGKTVPEHVAWKNYFYRPGMSSGSAAVGYDWEDVLIARSGGSNGSGGVIYDDVDWDPEEEGDDPDETTEPGGGGGGGDDVDPPGEGDHDEEDCGIIVASCQVLLDPPTGQARALANQVDPARFVPELGGAALEEYRTEFYRGLWDALGEAIDEAELVPLSDAVREFGLCEF